MRSRTNGFGDDSLAVPRRIRRDIGGLRAGEGEEEEGERADELANDRDEVSSKALGNYPQRLVHRLWVVYLFIDVHLDSGFCVRRRKERGMPELRTRGGIGWCRR